MDITIYRERGGGVGDHAAESRAVDAAVLAIETRPSPRESHPGTILVVVVRNGGGRKARVQVLRTELDLDRRVQTTHVQSVSGDASEPARRVIASMSPEEIWQTMLTLASGFSPIAFYAMVAVCNRRKEREQ